jgi:signal transduction histidine kinase
MRLGLRRPPRLWTLLLLSNLATLALPLTGLWALRLYESALVRQTEAELVAQGGVLTAAFQEELRRAVPGAPADVAPPTDVAPPLGRVNPDEAPRQGLDLARDPVLPPLPPAASAAAAASLALVSAGRALAPVLHGAQSVTLAALRLTDAHGVVVASTGGDLGASLAAWPEVAAVLAGAPIATTMHRRELVGPLTSGVSRTNGIRVFVVLRVADPQNTGVAGTVVASRSAKTLRDAARGKLGFLAVFAAVLLGAGTLLAIALSSLITRPLAGIVRQAQRVAAGGDAGPVPHPGTREVAELSAALSRMAATLDQRARYIAAFAASVSHAFKTPLAALRGAAELLQDEEETDAPSDRHRLLHVVADSTARLNLLVTRMLDLARADMTRPASGPAVPITPILTQLADRYRAQGLTVLLAGPPVTAILPVDGIEAILVSLLDNAQTHAGAAATVHITTTIDKARVRIDIQDDGPGISAANRARVFDPFFTTARHVGGTGLGLPIARAIAVGAGGSLAIGPSKTGAHFVLFIVGTETGI